MSILFDIVWLGGDPNRQSIRDKFAGTYVIRRKATPAGRGPIEFKIYFMFDYGIIFAEVVRTAAKLQVGQLSSESAVSGEVSS